MKAGDEKNELELIKQMQKDYNDELDKIVNKVCGVLKTLSRCITAVGCVWIAGYMVLGIIKILK